MSKGGRGGGARDWGEGGGKEGEGGSVGGKENSRLAAGRCGLHIPPHPRRLLSSGVILVPHRLRGGGGGIAAAGGAGRDGMRAEGEDASCCLRGRRLARIGAPLSSKRTHCSTLKASHVRKWAGDAGAAGERVGGWGEFGCRPKKRALPRGINRDGCIGQAGETRATYREWTHLTSGRGRPKNGRKSEGSDSCLTTRSRPKLRETFSPSKPAPPSITPAAMHRALVALAAAALVGNGELTGGWEAMGGGGARARKNTRWP